MQNKFCPMPFGSMHIDPNGQIKICCSDSGDMLDEQGQQFNIQTHTIKEAWNSKHYIQIRQDFLNGVQPQSCFQCWDTEIGDKGKSTRTASIDLYRELEPKGFDLSKSINEAKSNKGVILNSLPVDYQVMSGNLCNLACKMCFPKYSNTWSKFYINKNIKIQEVKYHSKSSDPLATFPDFGKEYDWPKTVKLQQIFSQVNDNIYHINITGGEPTLLAENLEFLEYLKTSKNISNIKLMVITNTTNVNKKLLSALDGFSDLSLISSLDGMDEIAYIQRTPSHWPTIYENFIELRRFCNKKPHINHCVVSTVTALNLHHVASFWNFLVTDPINQTNRISVHNIASQFVTGKYQLVGLGLVPRKVITKIRQQFTQFSALKKSLLYDRMINYLDHMDWAEDNQAMLEMLDTIQRLHPELDIKNIYKIYYE